MKKIYAFLVGWIIPLIFIRIILFLTTIVLSFLSAYPFIVFLLRFIVYAFSCILLIPYFHFFFRHFYDYGKYIRLSATIIMILNISAVVFAVLSEIRTGTHASDIFSCLYSAFIYFIARRFSFDYDTFNPFGRR